LRGPKPLNTSQQWLMPENARDVADVQPCMLLFDLEGRAWEWHWSSFMEIRGGRNGREWWWSGVVVTDVLAVAVTMFTCVVTATRRSVLLDRCFFKK